MGLNIQDARTGNTALVGGEGRLRTQSTTISMERFTNQVDGEAYSVPFSQSPTAADDCIFFLQNTSETDMIIEGVTIGVINATADDTIYFKLGDTGTRNSATALTPVNINAGSGRSAQGTFERGADLDGGTATLAGGSEFDRLVIAGATDLVSKHYNFVQDIIVPKNRTMTIWVGGSASGTWYGTVFFHYVDVEK